MKNPYKNIMKRPLSGEELYNALLGETKIILNSELHKYSNLDDLMKPYNNICLLYESRPGYGHWVCLILHKKDNIIEYFDPYGMFIDKPLEYTDKNYLSKSNQDFPYLSKLIFDSNYNVIYNKHKLQSRQEDIATCGRHILARITLSDIPLNKYIKIIYKNNNPDKNVSILTSGLDI